MPTTMESSGPEKALAFGLLGVAAAGLKKDAPRHVTAGCLATAIAFACVGGAGSALSKPEKRVAVALCGVVGFPAVAEIANRLFNLAFARAHFFPKGRTQLFNGRPAAEYAMGQGLFDVETGERIDTSSLDDKSFGAVKKNNFIRNTTAYRDRISDAETTVSEGDLVLFANGGCPWAHRVVVTRALLGLESAIPLLSTKRGFGGLYTLPAVSTMGWELDEPLPDAVCERSEALRSLRASFEGKSMHLYDIYRALDPHAHGRVTVPVLVDCRQDCIVNNESKEIVRLLNEQARHMTSSPSAPDLYPEALRKTIDALYPNVYAINNGVYQVGFANSAAARLEQKKSLFEALAKLENVLASDGRAYLAGNVLTEIDVFAFSTLLRFDLAYFYFFRCDITNLRAGFPLLHAYLLRLLQNEAINSTVNMYNYAGMYGTIRPWTSRVAGSAVRMGIVAIKFVCGAARPDAPVYRRWLASAISLPLELLRAYVPGYE